MTKSLVFLSALLACGAVRGALVTNFAASYALYAACANNAADFNGDQVINGVDFLSWQHGMGTTGLFINPLGDANRNSIVNGEDVTFWKSQYGSAAGIPDAVCFKLYFDPEGIINGIVTVVVDAPNPGAGQVRFGDRRIIDPHPAYNVQILQSQVVTTPIRQRLKAQVAFAAIDPLNPPIGPITLFGLEAIDGIPQAGLNVQASFEFRPGNFITIFDTGNGQSTTFDDAQLQDVLVPINVPLSLEIDVATGESRLMNKSSQSINLNHYEILSLGEALDNAGWLPLTVQEGMPGVGWELDGTASQSRLAETHITGGVTLQPSEVLSINHPFDSFQGVQDLRFFYRMPGSTLIPGTVHYFNSAPTAPVPEPAAGTLAVAALVALAAARRQLSKARASGIEHPAIVRAEIQPATKGCQLCQQIN